MDKQHALRKYLPHYDWLLYVDPDTFIMDRASGYQTLLALLTKLDAGGYHVAMAELHHSGVGGFDAGVVLIKRSAVGERFITEWLQGSRREWRNADNGFLNVLFLNWVLPASETGRCDHFLYKHELKVNGSMAKTRESAPAAVKAYRSFFPCFYTSLGLPTKPYEQMRLRRGEGSATDDGGRSQWKPFYVFHWDEVGVLSCAYPRQMSRRKMTERPIMCRDPIVYHAKDVNARFWSSPTGPNATNGRCV